MPTIERIITMRVYTHSADVTNWVGRALCSDGKLHVITISVACGQCPDVSLWKVGALVNG